MTHLAAYIVPHCSSDAKHNLRFDDVLLCSILCKALDGTHGPAECHKTSQEVRILALTDSTHKATKPLGQVVLLLGTIRDYQLMWPWGSCQFHKCTVLSAFQKSSNGEAEISPDKGTAVSKTQRVAFSRSSQKEPSRRMGECWKEN